MPSRLSPLLTPLFPKVQLLLLLLLLLLLVAVPHPASAVLYQYTKDEPLCLAEEVTHFPSTIHGWFTTVHSLGTMPAKLSVSNAVIQVVERKVAFAVEVLDPDGTLLATPLENIRWAPGAEKEEFRYTLQATGGSRAGAEADGPGPDDGRVGVYYICVRMTSGFSEMAAAFRDDESWYPLLNFYADLADGDEWARRAARTGINAARATVRDKGVLTFTDAAGVPRSTLRSKAYLDELDTNLRGLVSTINRIEGLLGDATQAEGRMRRTSESTFTRVWVCSVVIAVVMAVVIVMQQRMLRNILREKKIV